MRFFKITNGFERMTDAYLLVRAATIKTEVAAHSLHFPTPSPTLADLGATITAFEAAVLKAEGGNRQDIAEKNQFRETLIAQLHLLGNYVLFAAAGDEVVATSSGFNVSRIPSPRPALVAPAGFVLKNGAERGVLELKFKSVPGARGYIYEIAPSPLTPASQWESSMNTVCKKTYNGLDSGREYNFRVAAIGIKEQKVYSGVVSRIAL